MNLLTRTLGRICHDLLIDEKWLVAPSLRVGHQWLLTVTREGQPVINCHVKTITGLALELAGPEMVAAGVELISARGGEMFIDQIIQRLRQPGLGYLWQLPPSAGLTRAVYAAIDALRLADLNADRLILDRFEVEMKGRELSDVLKAYLKELQERKLIDRATVFRMAIDRLRRDPGALQCHLLVPEGTAATGLERSLLEALQASQKQILPIDEPRLATAQPAETFTDANLLQWLPAPAKAPPPAGDSTALIFRAIGEANEVREVLRRCLVAGYSIDEVELLYTDSETYVSLIYETFARLQPDDKNLDDLPVTFLEGIPARQFRPGRALVAWHSWMRDGFPQHILGQMIREGLLVITSEEGDEVSFSRLANVFRGIGIGFGCDRYLPAFDEHIVSLEQRMSAPTKQTGEDDAEATGDSSRLKNRLHTIRLLRGLVQKLIDLMPKSEAGPQQILAAARQFLEEHARHSSKMDNYARRMLLAQISDMDHWLNQTKNATSQNMWEWLAALPGEAWVGGSGPRGGCLHVAPVLTGGQSGRPHTFIVGLDDGRFPGAGLQDPVLLDSERHQLSAELPTAARRLTEKLELFARLLARVRGTVTLSYSCHDLVDDREKFPSPVLLAAFRILSGKHEGDQADLVHWLPAAASFAPEQATKSLEINEWWLWRLSGRETVLEPRALVATHFPHLGRGFDAARQRATSEFTIYDGWIPTPDAALAPTSPDGPIVSASRLEKLGQCPLAYFFKYVLRIESLDEFALDPDRWLDAMTMGSLLHTVFERFLCDLVNRAELPQFQRDEPRLMQILQEEIADARRLVPPPSEHVFRGQCRQLAQTTRIFLREEDEYYRRTANRPLHLEVSIGLKPDGHGTPLDTMDPVEVPLPGGGKLRARGRIDRIDQVGDAAAHAFAIWDYKTGSSWKFKQSPPFWQGRVVQHSLYVELMRQRFKAIGSSFASAQVTQFGFFFPSERSRGERLTYSPNELNGAGQILKLLSQIAATGSFLATNDHNDCKYCEYSTICGDVEAVAACSGQKLDNPNNAVLQPYLELRTHGQT